MGFRRPANPRNGLSRKQFRPAGAPSTSLRSPAPRYDLSLGYELSYPPPEERRMSDRNMVKEATRPEALRGRLSALNRVSSQIAAVGQLDEILASITEGLTHDGNAALARIWLLESDEGCPVCGGQLTHEKGQRDALHLRASAGLHQNVAGAYHRIEVGSHKIGEIARTRQPVCTNAVVGDPRVVDQAWVETHALRSFAGYPLVFGDRVVGVLGVFSRDVLSVVDFEELQVFANHAAIAIRNAQLFAEVERLNQRLTLENAYLKEELRSEGGFADIIGESPVLELMKQELHDVSPTDATVLLVGETGTGKELVARAIHAMSLRRERPLVKVNCGAIPAGLVESELFGHEKGSFTGALQRRIGRFELADGGTIFLDEIGELPLDAQVKLLRVLQEQEFERVGGSRPIRTDVRVIAATNRDLAAAVTEGRFRADLYYRLNVFPIRVPPLRERARDIPLLTAHFLAHYQRKLAKPLRAVTPDSMTRLLRYPWPGNIRELQNVLERACVLARGPIVHVADPLRTPAPLPAAPADAEFATLEEMERAHIRAALQRTGGIIHGPRGAAMLLGLKPTTLRSRMERLGIIGRVKPVPDY